MATKKKPPPVHAYAFDAHHRILIGCGVAVVVFAGLFHHVALPAQLMITWDAFTLTMLVMAWVVIATKDPYQARRNARLQDASATFVFIVVILAAVASLLAVVLVLHTSKAAASAAVAGRVTLATTAVILSWLLVHTAFTLRYAHHYYVDAREAERHEVRGGLIFPGRHSPSFLDFAYFSFVIGMTCQVSDVQISSPNLRRLALVHGMISFAFNTAILAMFVNIVAGLA